MGRVKLDWSAAEVKESKLSVDLDGEVTKEWKNSFEATVALLDHGEWGAVKLKKDTIRVSDVTVGSEEKLRFFLESAVTQANVTAEDDDEERADGGGDGDGAQEDGEHAAEQSEDAELTERFRAFASAEPEDD